MDFAVAVVGGGVVGLAVAAELARPERPLLIVERHDHIGEETSSRNSGVVHAGLHHPPAWLKSRLCVEGRRRLYAFAEAHGVPHRRCGKLIVAQDEAEAAKLEELRDRGRAAGVEGLTLLGREGLSRREPAVRGVAALESRESGIIDPDALMAALRQQAEGGGATVLLASEVVAGEVLPGGGFRLTVRERSGEESSCTAEAVVNAAGLDADAVARLFLPPEAAPVQRFAKGSWWRIAPRHEGRFQGLVYPVPPPGVPGLGIHLTLDLGGGLRLGPDVEWLAGRERDYRVDASRRSAFFDAAQRYFPALRPEDLSPDLAGIRAKLTGPEEPAVDFLIRHEAANGRPGLVNLLGIESPGLTACLAIAGHVAGLLA